MDDFQQEFVSMLVYLVQFREQALWEFVHLIDPALEPLAKKFLYSRRFFSREIEVESVENGIVRFSLKL